MNNKPLVILALIAVFAIITLVLPMEKSITMHAVLVTQPIGASFEILGAPPKPKPTPTPGGGGGGATRVAPVQKRVPVIEYPEITVRKELEMKQSVTGMLSIEEPQAKILATVHNIGEDNLIDVTTEVVSLEPETAVIGSIARTSRLNMDEIKKFPMIAKWTRFGFLPGQDIARFALSNALPVSMETIGKGELTGQEISLYEVSEIPIVSKPYTVMVTDIYEGYMGVYIVIDAEQIKTKDNEVIIEWELDWDKDLVMGDIFPSIKLGPGLNVIYKAYEVPDLPAQGFYEMKSWLHGKGKILSKKLAYDYFKIDFRKEVPTQFGKTMPESR